MSVLLGSIAAYSLVAYCASAIANWFDTQAEEKRTGNNLQDNQVQSSRRNAGCRCLRKALRRCVNAVRQLLKFIIIYKRIVKVSHITITC